MNQDFTLLWPLSCLKDGDHLSGRHQAAGDPSSMTGRCSTSRPAPKIKK